MFKEFLFPLVKFFTPFNLFQYISFRAAYAAVTSLLIAFVFGPRIIQVLRNLKAGQTVREDGPKTHLAKSGTPTMGGIIMLVSIMCSVLLWQDPRNMYTWLVLFAVFGFGLLGFMDDALKIFRKDSRGLRARMKLLGQFVVSGVIVGVLFANRSAHTSLLYLPFIKEPLIDLSLLYPPLAVIYLVAMSNAVNLTDGLDGLASGLVLLVALSLAALCYLTGRADYAAYLGIPYLPGSGELSVVSLALAGACVGFLWFNTHPAEVMMGDTGSLALGGLIGTIALIIKKELLLIIIGGVFVLEILSVVIQVVHFKFTRRRVFLMAPLHHHFELKGWPETKVVVRFWILGGMFAIVSLSTLKIL